jgi:RNA polymerase sigma-70 factor (ECF subfamily)
MAVNPRPFPSEEEGLRLHQRLVAEDPTAPSDLAQAYLDPLIDWVIRCNRTIDADLCADAAERAILALIKNPASYQTERGRLEPYLCMSAQGDLRNLLDGQKQHTTGRRSLDSVELSADARNSLGEEDDPSLPLQIAEAQQEVLATLPSTVREGLSEQEIAVVELMLAKERKTEVYARAYGIEHLPVEEQRREIKKVKDKLQKRIDRARDADE